MKVYDAVANAFLKEGTSTLFGLLGDGQMTWWSSLAKNPEIKIIDVRDEGAALAMAQGWARALGKTGVCSVTHGPGITRMTTSLVCAVRSHIPLVVYTSKTPFNLERDSQFLDQERLVSATGAGYIEVLTPSFAENAVRQAFYRARLESRPFVLSVPIDLQRKECDSDGDDYQPSASMFAGQQRIRPDLQRLNEAVRIITASRKPVIVIGRGAKQFETLATVKRLAQRIGALIATTLMVKGTLDDYEYHAGISGLFATRSRMGLFHEADCVIAIGAGLNLHTMAGGYLYPDARFIHIDVAPHIVMGNDRGADCYVQGDAAATTQELNQMLSDQGISCEGYHTQGVRKILQHVQTDPTQFEIEEDRVDPREAIRLLDEHLPPDAAVVTGTGHCFSFAVMNMSKRRERQVYVTDFGSIGQVLSNAVGVGVATNEPVVCIEGDGSAMQNIQELDTVARLGIKLLYFIMNDEAYGAEYHKLNANGLNASLSVVPTPDFGAVGRVFGCRGRLATNLDDVMADVREFLAGVGPMVLDVRISRRVINIPYRRMHFGEDV